MSDTPETDAAYSRIGIAHAQTSGDLVSKRYLLSARLERERNQARQERDELKEALLAITSNKFIDLGDLIYKVRELEGEGWHGDWVTHWSESVEKVRKLLPKLKENKSGDV